MNRHDDSLNFITLTRPISMNFDDNEEPRRSIDYESDDQKLAPSGDLAINANDVLCGRGKTSFNHVGNRRFRHIISESIDDYNNAGSRKAKSAVVKRVHDNIRATGGRFLKLDSAQRMWVELTQQRSLEKVSHAIRDATSTNENMKKKKKQVHSTIAQVAAHVQSRFPSVHLEGKLDDDDTAASEERLAFKSIESLHMSMPTLPAASNVASASSPLLGGLGGGGDDSSSRSASARLESVSAMPPLEQPMPPLHHPLEQQQRHLDEQAMPLLHMSSSSSSAPAKLHFPEDALLHPSQHLAHRRPSSLLLGAEEAEEMPPLRPSTIQLQQQQQQLRLPQQQQQLQQALQEVHQHEDDFVSYINEVLGPVSPTDLDIDPLKKLARRKKGDDN